MTKARLCTLLDLYEQKVTSDEDRKLGAAAVQAAQTSAPRAAYFTMWIGSILVQQSLCKAAHPSSLMTLKPLSELFSHATFYDSSG